MNIELINTGAELLLGRVLNTHQQWLCRQLADRGYVVSRQVAVADEGPAIQQAVREALGRADLVITTGGLGPTSDDITRDKIADLLGVTLRVDAAVLASVEGFFARRKRPMPESTRVQARVPDGAIVLPNANGTAPGLVMEVPAGRFREANRSSWLVMLPGPPRELRPMFLDQVVPLIHRELPLDVAFICRTLHTSGIGESQLEEIVSAPLAGLVAGGLELGYCARTGEVDVRFVARGGKGQQLVREAERIVRGLVEKHIFGVDDDELQGVVIRLLTERRRTVVTAESCTGGYIANRLTNVAGASAVFLGGVVTYSNALKQQLLGVRELTLEQHGAVSAEVASEMAEGALQRLGADFAIAVTGIAGPSGGTVEKPVGTVFSAVAGPSGTTVLRHYNPFDRETFKYVTSQHALETLRRVLV